MDTWFETELDALLAESVPAARLREASTFDPYADFPSLFGLRNDEVFVDCGAFDGDTLRIFLNQSGGRFAKVFTSMRRGSIVNPQLPN